MEQAIGLFLLTLLAAICLVALLLTLRVLFPKVTEATVRAAAATPGRSFAVGLVNVLFFGTITLVLADAGNPALIPLVPIALGIMFGLAGTSSLVGTRLFPGRTELRQMIWGAVLVILSSLTPLFGWFLLFPYLALVGLGAFILGWFRREPRAPLPPVESLE